jgi:hypothetical protein
MSTRSEMDQDAPTRQVKGRVTPEQPVRCSQLLTHEKKGQSLAMHPMLHDNKGKTCCFSRSEQATQCRHLRNIATIGTTAWQEDSGVLVRRGAASLRQQANSVTVLPSTVASIT